MQLLSTSVQSLHCSIYSDTYNQPRVVSTQIKFALKVVHLTIDICSWSLYIYNISMISLCLRASLLLEVSPRQIRWNGGQSIEYEMKVKPKKVALKGCTASLMTEWSKINTVNVWTTEAGSNSGYCQPWHLLVPKRLCCVFIVSGYHVYHVILSSPIMCGVVIRLL